MLTVIFLVWFMECSSLVDYAEWLMLGVVMLRIFYGVAHFSAFSESLMQSSVMLGVILLSVVASTNVIKLFTVVI